MAVIIIAVTWRWAGYNAIIILAGLQSIPEDVYEAATLDRGQQDSAVLLHHPAAAEADHPVLHRAVDHRHDAAVHRAVPDHQPRRAGRRHRDARAVPLPAGLHLAQFRLRLGDRLHHGGAGVADLAAPTCGPRERPNEKHSSPEIAPQHRAASGAAAAGADLAVPAVDDGGLLDHAGQRHLQSGDRAVAHRQFRRQFPQSAARHRFRQRMLDLHHRWR